MKNEVITYGALTERDTRGIEGAQGEILPGVHSFKLARRLYFHLLELYLFYLNIPLHFQPRSICSNFSTSKFEHRFEKKFCFTTFSVCRSNKKKKNELKVIAPSKYKELKRQKYNADQTDLIQIYSINEKYYAEYFVNNNFRI